MEITAQPKIKSEKGLLVAPFFIEDLKTLSSQYPQIVKDFLLKRFEENELKSEKGSMISTYIDEKSLPKKLLVVNFGEVKKINGKSARILGAKISKAAEASGNQEINLIIDSKIVPFAEELLEGIGLAQYKMGKFKTGKNLGKDDLRIKKINIIVEKKHTKEIENKAKKAQMIYETVEYVKDLVNGPPNIVNSEYLAKEAVKIAKENKCKVAVLGEKELRELGCGAILAVNDGSHNEAKLIVLEYDGDKNKKSKPLVFVGKGITFDSGGYNLKPRHHIETMHLDMAGAAVLLGLFKLLRKFNVKKNIVAVIPVAENLISGKSFRPSDIIKTFSGKTVEVTYTDAEGRLILADAITYGAKLNPEAIITVATLTGAVEVALGDRYAGIMGNSLDLRKKLSKAGKQVDELVWPLPLHEDYYKKFDSEIADMRNYDTGTSGMAGSSKGGLFLSRFMEGNKWVHIDLGKIAFIDNPQEFQTKGATAYGLRLLVRFLENV
ncbi:MAG: leucyl aminopeptidase [Patescibacteria group bacterium]